MSERADSIRVVHPPIQAEGGGSTPTSALQLVIEPISLDMAKDLNELWHSRLPRFGTGCVKKMPYPCFGACIGCDIYAVAIWSNPVARMLPQREWLELRRLAISPDAPRNTASRMLAVMARLIRKSRPEVTRLISYSDTEVHTGAIYRAAGWTASVLTVGKEWSNPSRLRPKSQSTSDKQRWEKIIRQ